MSDWFFDNMGWFILAMLVAVGFGTCAIVQESAEKRERFMTECVADGQKRYKCEVMYDSAQPDVHVTHPIVVGR